MSIANIRETRGMFQTGPLVAPTSGSVGLNVQANFESGKQAIITLNHWMASKAIDIRTPLFSN